MTTLTTTPATVPWFATARSAAVRYNGRLHQIDSSHPSFTKVAAALRSGDFDVRKMVRLMDPALTITSKGFGAITVDKGTIRFKGRKVNKALQEHLLRVLEEKGDLLPWLGFADRVYRNPLKSAQEELHLFLQGNGLPLTPDGCFLAYKFVRADYFDCHSGTVDYSVGKVASMPRAKVDTDRYRTCSTGLHFASASYVKGSGARIITVKVDPADVVAIPSDHNNAKGRAWRLESVGELVIPTLEGWLPDPQGTQTEGLVKKGVVSTSRTNQSITTEALGVITKTKLLAQRKEYGSWNAVARHLGVSTGTVAAWVAKLGLVKKPRA